MKPKYPERYEPGELQATRQRLGDLSEADAKKYARMLGGDIGVEKPKNGTGPESTEGGGGVTGPEEAPRFVSVSGRRERKVPYLQRIKIDFLCASPAYRLKTTGNALLSLVRFLFPGRDYVHPFFITHGEEIFYTNIENLVTAVRALLAVAEYTKVLPAVWKYYRDLLRCAACWNIEGINTDILRLQQHPKRKHMKALRSLVRNIYVPFVRLSSAEASADLFRGLYSVYTELVKLGITGGKRERITTYYSVAKAELPIVFGRIKKHLYPLVMKVFDTDFISYEEMFSSRLDDIALPLTVRENRIIKKEGYPEQPEDAEVDEDRVEELSATEDAGENVFLLSPRYGGSGPYAHGSNLIEALFPRCCWKTPGEFVDFYAYFSPLLPYPKGTEILAPRSALTRVITLMLIIQELLPGFREIDFGIIRDADENPVGLQLELGQILANWYRYGEEVLGKQYIPMLQEYCRNIEQDIRFRGSSYGKKLMSELNWISKHYFLPYMLFRAETGTRPPAEGTVAPLPGTVSTFLFLLSGVVEDNVDPAREVTDSVKNPRQPFYFEVETVVSRRLRTVLTRNGVPPDNAALIDTVYLLLLLLDGIINNPIGEGYEETGPLPYRTEGNAGTGPVYTVSVRDTLKLLAEDEEQGPSER